jgi:protein phosphatase
VVSQIQTATVPDQQLDIRTSAVTDVGGRSENEDAILVRELEAVDLGDGIKQQGLLLAVADGMGGHDRGEVASRLAIDTIQEVFLSDPVGDVVPLIKQAFRRANEIIFQSWQDAVPAQLMGTTLIVGAIRGKYITIASIGDSRAYLCRAGRLQQITRDHTLVADQVEQGHLMAEEARESPHRNIITHALGHKQRLDSKMPNVFELTLLEEDRVVIFTDGVYDVLSDDELLPIILEADPERIAERIVGISKERGTTDNVSVVAVSVLPTRDYALTVVPTAAISERQALPILPIAATILILAILGLLGFLLLF